MPFVPVPNAATAEMRYTQDLQRVENVLGIEFASQPSIPDLITVANALFSWWKDNLASLQPLNVTLREIYLKGLWSQAAYEYTLVPTSGNSGTNVSSPGPNNVTIAMSLRTGVIGRSFRGRIYHVGLTESQYDGNQLTSAAATSLLNAYANLITELEDTGIANLAVISRYTNNAPRTAGITTEVVAVTLTDTIIDSQRRRLPGRGR